MVRTTDIHSLTEFQRNAKSYIQQIKDTKLPIAITVNGEAEVVVQDARLYQAMVDELEKMRLFEAIREGEADVAAGRTRPADEVFAEIKEEFGFSD
ncbi:type II toxin-antitoxin system Phd/YefM family antitoxin [bacterium]|nr:MAG: type II toxin-antitoxin system Phd/YefM family antitoxin [bacterium]